jgi:hypothetical protein
MNIMKRSATQMYGSTESYIPHKRHKTTNDIYELMVSLTRRIDTIEKMCKIIFDECNRVRQERADCPFYVG